MQMSLVRGVCESRERILNLKSLIVYFAVGIKCVSLISALFRNCLRLADSVPVGWREGIKPGREVERPASACLDEQAFRRQKHYQVATGEPVHSFPMVTRRATLYNNLSNVTSFLTNLPELWQACSKAVPYP